jgi:hypothetical protein
VGGQRLRGGDPSDRQSAVAAAMNSLSDVSLVAPYRFTVAAALSVLSAATNQRPFGGRANQTEPSQRSMGKALDGAHWGRIRRLDPRGAGFHSRTIEPCRGQSAFFLFLLV